MTDMAANNPKALNFEEGLKRLEDIAQQMEKGDQPLDELLKLYEEGTKLSAELAGKLDEIEGRMLEVRKAASGEVIAVPADDQRLR